MFRAKIFSRAAARCLDKLDGESVTRQIDVAIALLREIDRGLQGVVDLEVIHADRQEHFVAFRDDIEHTCLSKR